MRKTYAYNGIIFGVLIGILLWASTENEVLGIVGAVVGSIVCFLIIRGIENLIYSGVNKASSAITRKLDEAHKNK